MSFLRVSPRLAELLAAPGNRAVFERERSVSAFLVEIEQV